MVLKPLLLNRILMRRLILTGSFFFLSPAIVLVFVIFLVASSFAISGRSGWGFMISLVQWPVIFFSVILMFLDLELRLGLVYCCLDKYYLDKFLIIDLLAGFS